MIPSNTICVSQEGPANALALNKDGTQVVIAGRNVFKVFSIGEDEFTEVCNLRVGKNLNLNFSSIDVAWSTIEENTLATAATNGAVVVWNLGRSGRSKQEHVFSDHKRTVNKVSFHLSEPSLLISGSQDGMMKCFDLRIKEVARTFISNTESIRDVQFSPLSAHTFAAVSENGSTQLWDVRRHEKPLVQFTAHSGPVFACDWHPAVPWLATASRDKTIKVWDVSPAKPTLEYTIYTIASVGNVKWRPNKKYQVSSCALVLDCAVHVWDVRRPHLPLATFAEHRDVTTALRWQSSSTFLATSRDCGLYRHRWGEAAHPLLWANPHAVALSARAVLASAVPDRPLPKTAFDTNTSPTQQRNERHVPGLGRKQPTAGSLSMSAQAALERAFPAGAASTLARYRPRATATDPATKPSDPVIACAIHYRIRGAPPHQLAEHNAKVATACNRHMVAHVWSVVAVCFGTTPGSGSSAWRAPPPPPAEPPPRAPPSPPTVAPDPPQEPDEWAASGFQNSGVLGKPTHSIYIPPVRRGNVEEDEAGWISAASAHYVDLDAADWTLPEEAFPLRSAPPHPHPPHPIRQYPAVNIDGATNSDTLCGGGGDTSPGDTSLSSSGSTTHYHAHASLPQPEESTSAVSVSSAPRGAAVRRRAAAGPLLAAALRLHADLGDVQTAAVVLLVLQEHRAEVLPLIEETLQEQWLLGYIELLQRHKLYNQATEVIRCAWVGGVWALSQHSTSVTVACARCGRRTKPPRACERCRPKRTDRCAVCRQTVRGLYAWCQGCAHGGHLQHMQDWLRQHTMCPAGCGHRCQLP